MRTVKRVLTYTFVSFVLLVLVSWSEAPPGSEMDRIRAFTRPVEFDYVGWMLDALALKDAQAALDAPSYLPVSQQTEVVRYYLSLVGQIGSLEADIQTIYSNPNIENPEEQTAQERKVLDTLQNAQQKMQPIVELILQQQVSDVLAENGLTAAGQPVPPVLYHVTDLPLALIVSPRTVIRQDANISLLPDLSLEEQIQMEDEVASSLDVSSLVVNVGGVGVYPPMVISSTNLPYLVETIAHEWTHNFLTLRPLGISYDASPALRTINETTAEIVGEEIGRAVLKRYYPDLAPPPPPPPAPTPAPGAAPTPTPVPTPSSEPPPFDFQSEMHETRVTVDQMLEQGKVQAAESYMEQRRQFFWEHGYHIRKLNQAYFAFYGAYAAAPRGAAGSNPVGPAVRALREQSSSLAQFLNRISWMASFETLQKAVAK